MTNLTTTRLNVACECLTEKEEEIAEEVSVCEYCEGTGELSVMEQVYANEPHYADTGTRPCICQKAEYEDDQDEN